MTSRAHILILQVYIKTWSFDHSQHRLWSYVGDYSIIEMLFEFTALAETSINKIRHNQDIAMSDVDIVDFL